MCVWRDLHEVAARFRGLGRVMKNTETHRDSPARFPRMMFIIALLATLGGAFAALQTSQPVREAFGLEPIIEGLPPRTLWTRGLPSVDDALPIAATVRHESTIVRTVGGGTRRAQVAEQRLVPSAQPHIGLTAHGEPTAAPTASAAVLVDSFSE